MIARPLDSSVFFCSGAAIHSLSHRKPIQPALQQTNHSRIPGENGATGSVGKQIHLLFYRIKPGVCFQLCRAERV